MTNLEFVEKMKMQAEDVIKYWDEHPDQDEWTGVQMADTLQIAKNILRLCDIIKSLQEN